MSKVTLKVNGKEIPLNPFVTNVFNNVVGGLVDALDKVPEVRKQIEVRIEEEK
jgi:hypothetical protein